MILSETHCINECFGFPQHDLFVDSIILNVISTQTVANVANDVQKDHATKDCI